MPPAGGSLVTEALQIEVGASEPWPKDVTLYQPYEVEQILLPDNCVCLAVQTFLRMCNLDFSVVMKTNAEHMSPSGKVPFIKANNFVISEMDPITGFVNSKGITLTEHLDASQKADMRAYMSLVTNVLGNAELYITWLDDLTYNEVTFGRYGSVYPWPLNYILTWQKRKQVAKKLNALGWGSKSLDEVYAEVENCLSALSERLDTHRYFFNNRPTELDALVFGHLFNILTTLMPDNRLAKLVTLFSNLVQLCQNIDKDFFDRNSSSPRSSEENFETLP